MADMDRESPQEQPGAREDTLATNSRRLRNGLISLTIFFALIVALLFAVPSLRAAVDSISDAGGTWVLAGIGLELCSCAGYVVLFSLIFDGIGRRLVIRLSLSELAVNSVVSASGIAGIALGAWVLKSRGFSTTMVARRSVLLFVLASSVNVAAVVVIGIPMWLGVIPGSTNPLLTLLPAFAGIAVIAGTLALATWARAGAESRRAGSGTAVAMTALGEGVYDALRLLRAHDKRLLGALVYWACDNLVLFACLSAVGHAPSFWVVAMAYLVGMLANSVPVPAGFIAVEGGLVGMLLLFGARPASAVLAAVVIYRAISLWVPALIGSLAFLRLRHEIGEPAASQATS
jgi:uncharacterized membrane protein YbhN (UPF0104 family)